MDALINVAFPVFGIILTGYLACRLGVLGQDSAVAINRIVYYFAMPPLLFVFTARAPIEKVLHWPFIGAFVGGGLLTLLVAVLVGRIWFRQDLETLTLHGLTSIFANTGFMGVPLLLTTFGPEGALPAILATVATNTVFLGAAIATLEAARASGPSTLLVISRVARMILQNPLLLAPFVGIAFSAFQLPIPKPIGNYLDLLAAAAGPAALLALGLSLAGRKVTDNGAEMTWLVVVKLLIHPLLVYILVTSIFSMEPLWSQAVIILAALPVGTVVFVVAQQYDVYVQRVSTAIVASTALSVASISLLLIWMRLG